MPSGLSKEATLREVLAEVSVLDVGRILKRAFAWLGCFAIIILIGMIADSGASYAMPNFHLPSWVIWLFWLVVLWG